MTPKLNWDEIGKNHRVFVLERPRTFWQWLSRKPADRELLIVSNKTIKDLPSQWTGPWMPAEVKYSADPMVRHRWRVENGLSWVSGAFKE